MSGVHDKRVGAGGAHGNGAAPSRRETALDEASVARLWMGIGARRRALTWRRRALTVGGLGAAATVLWLAAVQPSHFASDDDAVAEHAAAMSAPVRLSTDTGTGGVHTVAAPEVFVAATRPQHFALDDGSAIDLASGAQLETRANTGTAFTAHLHGSGTFEVKPGGARRWSIVADLVTVDVIGTRFQILEEPAGERVVVEHGIVLVRGDHVPGHLRRLVDGESLAVPAPVPASPLSIVPPVALAAASAEPMATPATPAPQPPNSAPSASSPRALTVTPVVPPWKTLAQGGDYAAAYQQLGPEGLSRATAGASVDDLLMLADVARLSAHGAEAVGPLSRVVGEHSNDGSAPLAAFTLGRLELDSLGHPAAGAKAFARAIALGLPGGLVEDAYARLVEADVKAGDAAGARAVAAEYAAKFPQGRRAAAVEHWVHGGGQ